MALINSRFHRLPNPFTAFFQPRGRRSCPFLNLVIVSSASVLSSSVYAFLDLLLPTNPPPSLSVLSTDSDPGHNYIGFEHFLSGLLCEGQGVAARVLDNLGPGPSNICTQDDVGSLVAQLRDLQRWDTEFEEENKKINSKWKE